VESRSQLCVRACSVIAGDEKLACSRGGVIADDLESHEDLCATEQTAQPPSMDAQARIVVIQNSSVTVERIHLLTIESNELK
jgi:hypothetical protein